MMDRHDGAAAASSSPPPAEESRPESGGAVVPPPPAPPSGRTAGGARGADGGGGGIPPPAPEGGYAPASDSAAAAAAAAAVGAEGSLPSPDEARTDMYRGGGGGGGIVRDLGGEDESGGDDGIEDANPSSDPAARCGAPLPGPGGARADADAEAARVDGAGRCGVRYDRRSDCERRFPLFWLAGGGGGGGGSVSESSDGDYCDDDDDDGEGTGLNPARPDPSARYPAWSGSLLSPEEAKAEVASVRRIGRCGGRCTERRFRLLWLYGCLSVLTVSIGTILGLAVRSDVARAAANYDQDFEELFESGALHDFDGLGNIEVSSAAFGRGAPIPTKYTADGEDLSPPISWENVPPGTKSLVLLMDEKGQTISHWVVYDVPPALGGLPEGIPPHTVEVVPKDDAYRDVTFFQGLNSWGDGSHGYKGPDPSSGTGLHYYSFSVFAVDVEDLDVKAEEATRAAVMEAMERAKVLGYGKLVGTYQRFSDS